MTEGRTDRCGKYIMRQSVKKIKKNYRIRMGARHKKKGKLKFKRTT
jgi:hypothetical protein